MKDAGVHDEVPRLGPEAGQLSDEAIAFMDWLFDKVWNEMPGRAGAELVTLDALSVSLQAVRDQVTPLAADAIHELDRLLQKRLEEEAGHGR